MPDTVPGSPCRGIDIRVGRPQSSPCAGWVGAMKARQLIAGAAFGPEVLKVIGKAFDDAWAEVAPSVGDRPLAVQAARLRLVNIILSLTTESTSDGERLRVLALEAYRRPLR